MNLLRAFLFRFRALIFIIIGIFFLTIGLPITTIVWLISGKNLVYYAWETSDKLINGI